MAADVGGASGGPSMRRGLVLVLLWPVVVAAQGRPSIAEQRFEDYVQAHAREHALEAAAVRAAKEAIDVRLGEMNNLRAQITAERGQFITRNEHEALRSEVLIADQRSQERIGALESQVAGLRSAAVAWGAALGIFFTIIQVALRFLPFSLER